MNALAKAVGATLVAATVATFASSADATPLSAGTLPLKDAASASSAFETVRWRAGWGGWRGGWGWGGWHRGWGWGGWGWGGLGIGLAAGAIIGSALASAPYYSGYYGYYAPAYYGGYGYGGYWPYRRFGYWPYHRFGYRFGYRRAFVRHWW